MPEHLIRFLHALYAAPSDGVADTELLARVAMRDDAAFELLVRRHAALVWRTCRAVARDHHAAEDAFQATFLALATKAASVRGSVAAWLYRVAYHAALKARPTRERPGPMPELAQPETTDSAELAALLHDELVRLPDRYRDPVILCHLHGVTQADAAKQLGLPVGTIATHVRRGLERLRTRLTARGVAPAVGLFTVVGASAAPPVAPAGAVPVHITRLSEGAFAAMTPTNWKPLAASVLATLGLGLTVAFASLGPTDDPPKPAAPVAAAQPAAHVHKPAEFWQARASLENLKKIAYATHGYLGDANHLPRDITDKDGKPILSWRVAILPYMDQRFLHAQFKLDEPWDSDHNKKLLAFMPDVFRTSVQDVKVTETYYQAVSGPGAIFDPKAKVGIQDIQDGTSNTLLVVEAGPPVPWTKPADIAFDPAAKPPVLEGPYTDATHAACADGSTYRMKPKVDDKWLQLLILRNDGTPLPRDETLAPPAKPVTEAERKQLTEQRAYLVKRVLDARMNAEHRFRVEHELSKHGAIPYPDPTRLETLEELEELADQLNKLMWSDQSEVWRLMDELKKKDPKAAERLEKEFREARVTAAKRKE